MNGRISFPRASSQAWAGSALSGAGPYSSVSKISAIVMALAHGVAEVGGVTAGGMVLELALQVGQEARRADAEELAAHPGVAQLFLHQGEPVGRIPGGGDPAGRFEADAMAGALAVFADGAHHHEGDGQGGVDLLLARG